MSSEYMRQILESIDRAQDLYEGYEDRVNNVAGIIRRDYPEGITKKEFASAVEKAGKESGATEMRGTTHAGLNQRGIGDSRKDFIKDVAAKIDFRRDNSANVARSKDAAEKRERTEKALERLAWIIQEETGNSWPDGDPWDNIAPKARKLGIPMDRLLEWLDRATKKYIGGPYKTYHDYVAMTWDDFQDQTNGMRDQGDRRNPWR
jgi:hypothetical protein